MTATVTTEQGQVAVFVAVDHCSAECVGIHAALHGTRHEALEPVRQGVKAPLGAIGIRQCRSNHWRTIGSSSLPG